MNGVTFGDYHSFDNLALILSKKEIGSPKVKNKTIEVEGADGVLDYTDFFGDVKYENRTLKFEFSTIIAPSGFMDWYSTVQNAINGKKMKIVLDEDNEFYYYGRASVSAFTNEKSIGVISIECDCEPYKYKKDETVVTQSIGQMGVVTLMNSRKIVVPTITTTTDMIITVGTANISTTAGTFQIPQLELKEGKNTVPVRGAGTITFKYREGKL